MLIIGAGGHAKEILDVFEKRKEETDLYFYDDISINIPELLYGKYRVLRKIDEVRNLFLKDKRFVIGIGNPLARRKFANHFIQIGGDLTSIISPNCVIGNHNVVLGHGLNIMHGVIITNDVNIGDGTLINANANVHHGSTIGKYCEISPGCRINGNVRIGNYCSIGSGSVLIPQIVIGNNVTIGAGRWLIGYP